MSSSSCWAPSACLMSPPRTRSAPASSPHLNSNSNDITGVADIKQPLSFMLSSAFLNEERQANELLMGSPSFGQLKGGSFLKSRSMSEATASTIATVNEGTEPSASGQEASNRTLCDRSSSSYLKAVDYTSPTATVHIGQTAEAQLVLRDAHNNKKAVSFSEQPLVVEPTTQPKRLERESDRHKVLLQQEPVSLQTKLREADERLRRTCQAPKGKELLFQGLPYTWREIVPFDCPITHPEIMSYDPNNYHSVVAKQTRDIGMRVINLSLLRKGQRSVESIDLNVERGVKGMSLRKHSTQYRMERLSTYPGIGAVLS